jgi:hypothetical protein
MALDFGSESALVSCYSENYKLRLGRTYKTHCRDVISGSDETMPRVGLTATPKTGTYLDLVRSATVECQVSAGCGLQHKPLTMHRDGLPDQQIAKKIFEVSWVCSV